MTEERKKTEIPVSEWEKFINSRPWKELERELKEVQDLSSDQMINSESINDMCRLQGRVKALSIVIGLPHEYIRLLKEDIEKDRLEQEEQL